MLIQGMDIRSFFQPHQEAVPAVTDPTTSPERLAAQQDVSVLDPPVNRAAHHVGLQDAIEHNQHQCDASNISGNVLLPHGVRTEPQQWSVLHCMQHMALHSKLPGAASAQLQEQYLRRLHQVCSWDAVHLASSFPVQHGMAPLLNLTALVTCHRFDNCGQLLLSGASTGVVALWSWNDIRRSARLGIPESMLTLHTGMKVSDVQWNHINQAEAAICGTATDTIMLYNLEVCENKPTKRLKGSPNCQSVMEYSHTGRFTAVATGPSANGQVFLWDERKAVKPCATLKAPADAQRLTCLAILPSDDTMLAAGSTGNRVVLWDLRGGRGGALQLSAQGTPSYPVLRSLSIRDTMLSLPELLQQGTVDDSAVQQIAIAQKAPFRAAFRTGKGWTGVVDLLTGNLTHLHAPPAFRDLIADEDDVQGSTYLASLQERRKFSALQQGAWCRSGNRFVVPSALHQMMHWLDFAEDPTSAAFLSGTSIGSSVASAPRAVTSSHVAIELPCQAITVATHPVSQQVVWGDTEGNLNLLDVHFGKVSK